MTCACRPLNHFTTEYIFLPLYAHRLPQRPIHPARGRGTAPFPWAQLTSLSRFLVSADLPPHRRRCAVFFALPLFLRHTPAGALADAFPPKADAGVCPARALIGDVSFGLTWIWGAAQVFGYLSNRLKLLKSRAKRQNTILC